MHSRLAIIRDSNVIREGIESARRVALIGQVKWGRVNFDAVAIHDISSGRSSPSTTLITTGLPLSRNHTNYKIAPSILSADFARLGEEVRAVIDAGADLIHFDVMDNHYVPNLTIGPMVCSAIKPHVGNTPIDVHLMVKPVDAIIPEFAKAGANIISFHPEASEHVDRTISLIHECGCKAGLVFNPATPLDYLDYTLDNLDLVLIMSVNPGFGGQKFIDGVLPKITEARGRIAASGREILLEVDGGVKADNIAKVAAAGADTFVAGSAIYGAKDYAAAIQQMRAALRQ